MKETTIKAVKGAVDIAAAGVATGLAVKLQTWLPIIASALSIAWMLVRFYEWAKSKSKRK